MLLERECQPASSILLRNVFVEASRHVAERPGLAARIYERGARAAIAESQDYKLGHSMLRTASALYRVGEERSGEKVSKNSSGLECYTGIGVNETTSARFMEFRKDMAKETTYRRKAESTSRLADGLYMMSNGGTRKALPYEDLLKVRDTINFIERSRELAAIARR
ncbi:MAG: hypothetical protein KGI00_01705 [Candidatus Micrarchaeota archaeon]|nr:hypothetical protein [Candidatus Micrarchaeota archaeon]MDE1849423.1 hypothetical protein [Candidatus Micrarchaeota archaeon]